jgi:hypothetical protein
MTTRNLFYALVVVATMGVLFVAHMELNVLRDRLKVEHRQAVRTVALNAAEQTSAPHQALTVVTPQPPAIPPLALNTPPPTEPTAAPGDDWVKALAKTQKNGALIAADDGPADDDKKPLDAKQKKKGHHHHHQHKKNAKGHQPIAEGTVAFAVVVSNEEFVDGALTLAWSFRNHSKLFNNGKANLALIAPQGALCDESLARLAAVGWKDQRLVNDLTKQAPESAWAGTFNKLYLFNLTEYQRVAYFDVDMLMLRSPDDIFDSKLPNASYIGALGNSHDKKHKPYFQTGMMLVIPTADAFTYMMKEFEKKSNRGLNGRDGVIIRNYYKERYINIDDRLSMHLKPEEGLSEVIGFHFRGSFKPWFDRSKPPKPDPRKGGGAKGEEREIGPAYELWWAAYEDLHKAVLADLPMAVAARDPGATIPPHYNPTTHVWMMRHTPESYLQPLSTVAASQRNLTVPGLVLEVSLADESCDFVCGLRQALCVEEALVFEEVNSCARLQALFGCSKCEPAVPHPAQPALHVTSHKCAINSLDDASKRPRCAEVSHEHKRLCPCLPLAAAAGRIVPVPFAQGGGLHTKLDAKAATSNAAPLRAEDRRVPCDGRFTSFVDEAWDRACVEQLAKVQALSVAAGAIPGNSYSGVTTKILVTLTDGTRAVVKVSQAGFFHEAQSEVAAFHVDRLLGFNRVPPTALAWVTTDWLGRALENITTRAPPATTHAADSTARTAEPTAFKGVAPPQDAASVLEFLRSRPELHGGTTGNEIGVSVQLWVDDLHRMADTTLAVPDSYGEWFGKQSAVPADVPDPSEVLPALSDLTIFDYVLDNADRGAAKNLFVAGGCKAYCVNSRTAPHFGAPTVVFLDQGHSFYDLEDKNTNVLDVTVSGGDQQATATLFCKARRRTREALNRYIGDGETAATFAGDLRKAMDKAGSGRALDAIGEGRIASAQARLVRAARHLNKHCPTSDASLMLVDRSA